MSAETLVLAVRVVDDRLFVRLMDGDGVELASDQDGELLASVDVAGLREVMANRETTDALPAAARRLGNVLFPPKIRAEWKIRAHNAKRVFLELDATLTPIPWEMVAYDDRLFLNPGRPFSRRTTPTNPSTVSTWPIDVLIVLAASPPDLTKIGGFAELAAIRMALKKYNRSIHVTRLPMGDAAVSRQAVQTALNNIRPHVLHVIGHGDDDALRLWTGKENVAWTTEAVTTDLAAAGFTPPLIYLNACRTATGRDGAGSGLATIVDAFMTRGARAVIAMQGDIDGDSAARCAGAFYQAIAAQKPVDVAMAAARIAVDSGLDANKPGLRERRDAYLPVLTTAGPIEDILPAWADVCAAPTAAIGRMTPLDQIVQQLVNHETSRRDALRGFFAQQKPHALMLVHGEESTGKSWLIGWCIDGWLRRGMKVRYATMFSARTLLEAALAILDGDPAHGAIGQPLAEARESFADALTLKRTKTGAIQWPKKTLDAATLMKAFHHALSDTSPGGIVLVLDQFASDAGQMNDVVFNDLWKHWIERYVIGSDGPVRVVLGLPAGRRAKLSVPESNVCDVRLDLLKPGEFAVLMEELIAARDPELYQRLKPKFKKFLKGVTAPADSKKLTMRWLSKYSDSAVDVVELMAD